MQSHLIKTAGCISSGVFTPIGVHVDASSGMLKPMSLFSPFGDLRTCFEVTHIPTRCPLIIYVPLHRRILGSRAASQAPPGGGGAPGLPARSSAGAGSTGRRASEDVDAMEIKADESRGNGAGGGATEGDGERAGGHGMRDAVGQDEYSQNLKIKAAQALFRMSLEQGGEVRLPMCGREYWKGLN